jgi:3' exoribonuclease, RNase T-like
MKYFIDTEFLEDGKTIELISIGIIREDGNEFYRENSDFDKTKATQWLKINVLPSLFANSNYLKNKKEIANDVLEFLANDDAIEFWGYFADYDWVVFCQLFGRMIDLPKPLPMFCMDLKQLVKMKGLKIKQENSIHNALQDARWIKENYFKYINL